MLYFIHWCTNTRVDVRFYMCGGNHISPISLSYEKTFSIAHSHRLQALRSYIYTYAMSSINEIKPTNIHLTSNSSSKRIYLSSVLGIYIFSYHLYLPAIQTFRIHTIRFFCATEMILGWSSFHLIYSDLAIMFFYSPFIYVVLSWGVWVFACVCEMT